MGDFLSLTRARKEKSRPSRAMAKMIRGRGNMEPSRLGASVGRKTSNGDESCTGTRRRGWKSVSQKGEEYSKGKKWLSREGYGVWGGRPCKAVRLAAGVWCSTEDFLRPGCKSHTHWIYKYGIPHAVTPRSRVQIHFHFNMQLYLVFIVLDKPPRCG